MTATQEAPRISPPTVPGEWSLKQVQEVLGRQLPANMLETKTQSGTRISYIPWHTVNSILDKYCPGWTWEIRQVHATDERLFLVGRITIPTSEGNIYREASGTETLKEWTKNKSTGEMQLREIAYGDPSSNAESMAFRRAAARFGLGLYLYKK